MKKNVKVLMIISSFYPMVGGAEKQAFQLARSLNKKGIDCTILTRQYPGVPDKEEIDGVKVIRKGIYSRTKMGSFISAGAWLFFVLKHTSVYNILHAHQPFSSAFVAGIIGKIKNIPTVVKIPSTAYVINNVLRLRVLDNLIDAFVVTNKESYIHVRGIVKKSKVFLIHNGINISSRMDDTVVSERNKIVLTVGRLEQRKGFEILIYAWKKVIAKIPDVKLVIVGSGTMENRLRKIVSQLQMEESVIFTGKLKYPELEKWYLHASCYVNPSYYEGISNSLLEAVSYKIPAIVSDIPGNRDVIFENNGWIFEPGNIDDLAEKIIYVLSNPEEARNMANRAYDHLRKKFSMDNITNQYIQMYRFLLDQIS